MATRKFGTSQPIRRQPSRKVGVAVGVGPVGVGVTVGVGEGVRSGTMML